MQVRRENNLQDVTVEIPKRRLTVLTGTSGSGKSSLVLDTIAAEPQRLCRGANPGRGMVSNGARTCWCSVST
jgi:excinuclease UvrABC ATPase subunit